MRYSSDDALRTGERNVNLNKKNTLENVASNKMLRPDQRPLSFIFKQYERR